MLLDLGRNDVGRVSEFGSVSIPEKMIIENYSHVMHICSSVTGRLARDKDQFDALISGFPAGTVTGAPKIRAMEIIYELEPDRRDIYSGALGFFDFEGNVNTCIVIRTLIMKDGKVYFVGLDRDILKFKYYVKVEDVITVEGMDPMILADIYGLTGNKKSKKRGRKTKSNTV